MTATGAVLSILGKQPHHEMSFDDLEVQLDQTGTLPFGVDPIDVVAYLRREGQVEYQAGGMVRLLQDAPAR